MGKRENQRTTSNSDRKLWFFTVQEFKCVEQSTGRAYLEQKRTILDNNVTL